MIKYIKPSFVLGKMNCLLLSDGIAGVRNGHRGKVMNRIFDKRSSPACPMPSPTMYRIFYCCKFESVYSNQSYDMVQFKSGPRHVFALEHCKMLWDSAVLETRQGASLYDLSRLEQSKDFRPQCTPSPAIGHPFLFLRGATVITSLHST